LRGLFYWNKWTPGSIKKAMGYFEEAIGKEPRFAKAYSWVANCYVYLGAMGFAPSEIAYPKAKELALKALEFDSKLAEAYISIALTKFFFEWDWDGANQNFQRALELNPGMADVHYTYAMYLIVMGKTDEAINEAEQALRLDPLSPIINNTLGQAYINAGRYDDAIKEFDKALEIDPFFRTAIEAKGWTNAFRGNGEEAVKLFKRLQEITGKDYAGLSGLGYAYSLLGELDKTSECLERLKRRSISEPELSLEFDFAVLYASLKDYDKVFYYLNRAVEKKIGGIVFVRVSPGWKFLRSDPRFKQIMEKIGFK
jgi:tetratricopeptide (TPR) repeat protein